MKTLAAASFSILGFAGIAFSESPDPKDLFIDSLSYSGSGCEDGTVGSYLSDDGKAMTLTFDNFIVSTEDSPNQSRVKKNCRVNVGMNVPAGWSYGVFCVDFRGYASLDKNIVARQKSSYRFGNGGAREVGSLELKGEFDNEYTKLTATPLATVNWSRCGSGKIENVAIDTNITIEKPQPKPFVWHKAHHAAVMTMSRANTLYYRMRHKIGKNHPKTGEMRAVKDLANKTRDRLARRKPTSEAAVHYTQIQGIVPSLRDFILATPSLAGDHTVKRELPKLIKDYTDLGSYLVPAAPNASGLMTVDTIDGDLKHHYGIAWKRCDGGSNNCQEKSELTLNGAGEIAKVLMHSPYNVDGKLSANPNTNVAYDTASFGKVCEILGYQKVKYAKRHFFSSCRDDNVAVFQPATNSFIVEPGCKVRSMVKVLTCSQPKNLCN